MPLRKIADIKPSCNHVDHKPPMHIHLEAGIYEHECPKCGKITIINVPLVESRYDDESPSYITGTEDGV